MLPSARQSYNAEVTLNRAAKQDVLWWINQVRQWNSKPITMKPPDLTIQSDASLLGWGASTDCTATGGLWFPAERELHIRADGWDVCSKGICQGEGQPPHPSHDGQHISSGLCQSPRRNSVNTSGTTGKATLALVPGQKDNPRVSAEYLPGESNVSADLQSR